MRRATPEALTIVLDLITKSPVVKLEGHPHRRPFVLPSVVLVRRRCLRWIRVTLIYNALPLFRWNIAGTLTSLKIVRRRALISPSVASVIFSFRRRSR